VPKIILNKKANQELNTKFGFVNAGSRLADQFNQKSINCTLTVKNQSGPDLACFGLAMQMP
jgi:hypothetical protein